MSTADHPRWCDQSHNPGYPVHTRDVGDDDLPLESERDLAVSLYQEGEETPQVWIAEHGRMVTAVTPLTPGVARELGERLIAAVGLLDGIEVGDRSG
jgi:hypothetical protein